MVKYNFFHARYIMVYTKNLVKGEHYLELGPTGADGSDVPDFDRLLIYVGIIPAGMVRRDRGPAFRSVAGYGRKGITIARLNELYKIDTKESMHLAVRLVFE